MGNIGTSLRRLQKTVARELTHPKSIGDRSGTKICKIRAERAVLRIEGF